MGIRYTIATRSSAFVVNPTAVVNKRTAPAAAASLYNAVYDMLEARGMLDSNRARDLMAEVEAYAVKPDDRCVFKEHTFYATGRDDIDSSYVVVTAQRD